MEKMYNVAQQCFWRSSEISYVEDENSAYESRKNGTHPTVFAKLAQMLVLVDVVVSSVIEERMLQIQGKITDLVGPVYSWFCGFQLAMEHVHVQVYQRQFEALYGKSKEAVDKWAEIEEPVETLMEFVLKWYRCEMDGEETDEEEDDDKTEDVEYFLRTIWITNMIEGFMLIWILSIAFECKSIEQYPGFMKGNNFILRDELIHMKMNALIYKEVSKLQDKAEKRELESTLIDESTQFMIYVERLVDYAMSSSTIAHRIKIKQFGAYLFRECIEQMGVVAPEDLPRENPLNKAVNLYRPGYFVFLQRDSTDYINESHVFIEASNPFTRGDRPTHSGASNSSDCLPQNREGYDSGDGGCNSCAL